MLPTSVRGDLVNGQRKKRTAIIYQSLLDKVLSSNRRLAQRYLVLNSYALFVYKDDFAFNSFPHKPMLVIPLSQILQIKQGQLPKHSVAPVCVKPSSRGEKSNIHSIEIVLRGNLTEVQSLIQNYYCKSLYQNSLPSKASSKKKVNEEE